MLIKADYMKLLRLTEYKGLCQLISVRFVMYHWLVLLSLVS
jgi:hypothetical protein